MFNVDEIDTIFLKGEQNFGVPTKRLRDDEVCVH